MAQNKQSKSGIGCLAVIVLSALIWGGTELFGGSGTSYSATVGDFTPMNPADLAVTLHITNTGSTAGKPTCEVDAHDASYAYHGVNIGDLADPIDPAATKTTVMNVTITGQGAEYVTDVTVKCY